MDMSGCEHVRRAGEGAMGTGARGRWEQVAPQACLGPGTHSFLLSLGLTDQCPLGTLSSSQPHALCPPVAVLIPIRALARGPLNCFWMSLS